MTEKKPPTLGRIYVRCTFCKVKGTTCSVDAHKRGVPWIAEYDLRGPMDFDMFDRIVAICVDCRAEKLGGA
jgi:hypothetical protein